MRGSVLAPPKTMTEELFTLSVCAREGGGEGARERWGDSHEVPLIMVVGELEEVARPDIINRSMSQKDGSPQVSEFHHPPSLFGPGPGLISDLPPSFHLFARPTLL
jgi:hypothetical protein